jgi:hypothetical protein
VDNRSSAPWWLTLVAPAAGLFGAVVGAGTVTLTTRHSLRRQETNRARAAYHEQLASRILEAMLSLSTTFDRQLELVDAKQTDPDTDRATTAAAQLRAEMAETQTRSSLIDDADLRSVFGRFVATSNTLLYAASNEARRTALDDSADLITQLEEGAGQIYRKAVRFHIDAVSQQEL